MIEFTAGTVRMLNGAPLSVLVALMIDRQPHGVSWLSGVTGYSDKPVMAALEFLAEMGFVTRNGRYAWQLASGVQQLPFMHDALPEAEPDPEPPAEDQDAENRRGNIPRPGALASSSSINNLDIKENPLLESRADPENLRVPRVLTELDAAGVGEPKRSRLAAMKHVTPRMVRYHRATCANTGQAIYRIEHNWRVPADWIDPADAPPEPTQESEPEPLEVLTPLSDARLQAWAAAVASLPVSRAERETWLRSPPAGVSTETGALVLRVANRPAAEWIHAHALDDLQRAIGGPVRLEVGHG